jgi:hypothetical protein
MFEQGIPATFIQYAADILGDTSSGLSGGAIVKETAAYAVEYDVNIPHPTYPFDAPNKRTALYENLMAFTPAQQYRIIKELCDHRSFPPKPSPQRKELKVRLVTRYGHLAQSNVTYEINETLIEETRHWLDGYPDALALYNAALEKYEHGVFHRNLLDDLRLALEKLLRAVFANAKIAGKPDRPGGSVHYGPRGLEGARKHVRQACRLLQQVPEQLCEARRRGDRARDRIHIRDHLVLHEAPHQAGSFLTAAAGHRHGESGGG